MAYKAVLSSSSCSGHLVPSSLTMPLQCILLLYMHILVNINIPSCFFSVCSGNFTGLWIRSNFWTVLPLSSPWLPPRGLLSHQLYKRNSFILACYIPAYSIPPKKTRVPYNKSNVHSTPLYLRRVTREFLIYLFGRAFGTYVFLVDNTAITLCPLVFQPIDRQAQLFRKKLPLLSLFTTWLTFGSFTIMIFELSLASQTWHGYNLYQTYICYLNFFVQRKVKGEWCRGLPDGQDNFLRRGHVGDQGWDYHASFCGAGIAQCCPIFCRQAGRQHLQVSYNLLDL